MTEYAQPRARPGYEYRAKCRNCPYGKRFGAGRLQCEIQAGRHARKYGTHIVDVEEVRILHTFSGLSNMDQLPLDEPPF